MLTYEILQMLFDETGLNFEEWALDNGYDESWSDQQIYAALPAAIQELMGEFGLNASWMHDGM